ncbi:MAG: YgiQ family radical SAM protein, partial [Candidatus Methanomethylophilaceae archaeon]|nr:YgiQ family radical SAM protein [Candidatus Methanomethylophilaceae archaeon]
MFIPVTMDEVRRRGWKALDVILVSGDTYTDNSYNGTAVIGHWLIDHGFRVGMVAQPRLDVPDDITRLGEPELFWSVSAGCVDSMVANYTSTNKRRKDDDFTPGGINDRRPDRACIAYTNLIKKVAKGKPIILGGIEASLRRIAHYDMWSDSIRRSVLLDSKADAIVYGMGELSNLEIAQRIRDGKEWKDVRGICYMSSKLPSNTLELPSYEDCAADPRAFARMFATFRDNCDPITARPMHQAYGNRFLVHNRPQRNLAQAELDAVHESDYENAVHPYYARQGHVKAMDTVENSITTHRGCYGECSFCAIAMHQGRAVVSRSEESTLREVRRMASKPGFNGIIRDVGGPTANMYGIDCDVKAAKGACRDRRCLGSSPCPR